MTLTKKLLSLAAVAALSIGTAHAALSLSQAIVPGVNLLSDDDAELLLKKDAAAAGGYRAFVPGTDMISVDDIFVGIVKITSFPTGAAGTSSSLYNEITAFYAAQVLTTTPGLSPLFACGASSQTTCTGYTFGAASVGLNGVVGLVNANYGTTIGAIANVGANSFASVYEDTTPDFDRATGTGNFNSAFASATDGTQRFVFDLNLANGVDTFSATGASNPAQLGALAAAQNGGSISILGTVSYQNVPGWIFSPQVSVTGNIMRAESGPFGIWSDSTYGLSARALPEPGALALVGLALAGAGVASRRKAAAKA